MSQDALKNNADADGEGNGFLAGMNTAKITNVDRKSFTNRIEESFSQNRSVIGKNIKFRGELIGNEDLHIEGTVEGVVKMEGQDLSVGQEGTLNANVHAKNLTIHGKLTGDVLADELIEIKSTAIVKGNLIAPRIQLDDGGKFRGSMDMTETEDEITQRHTVFKKKLIHPDLSESESEIVNNQRNEADKNSKSSMTQSVNNDRPQE